VILYNYNDRIPIYVISFIFINSNSYSFVPVHHFSLEKYPLQPYPAGLMGSSMYILQKSELTIISSGSLMS
jgi:hypothetical protein